MYSSTGARSRDEQRWGEFLSAEQVDNRELFTLKKYDPHMDSFSMKAIKKANAPELCLPCTNLCVYI